MIEMHYNRELMEFMIIYDNVTNIIYGFHLFHVYLIV